MSARQHLRGEFNARYKAGSWAARLETQDTVAAICSVEAIAGMMEFIPSDLLALDGRVLFEAREDFEIRWQGGRQYVSVKDKQVNASDLKQAVSNLEEFASEVTSETHQTLRLEAASLTSSARSLDEDIVRLRELKGSATSADDYQVACHDFEEQHSISADWATKVVVAQRRLGDNPSFSEAVFSHAMRQAFPVHNYGNGELSALLVDLCVNTLSRKRKRRGVLDLSDLERLLLAPLIPISIATYETHYFRTDFGYLPDRGREVAIRNEYRIVTRAARKLMHEWRRQTFLRRFLNIAFRGAIRCLACNHPMIANLNGSNGIACPDCGYQPYCTLFWACDCGGAAVVQRQPDLINFVLIRDAVSLLRQQTPRCEKCGKAPSEERFIGRVFTLRIPYPPADYTDAALINWRKQLGWNGARWDASEGRAPTPREEMIRRSQPDRQRASGGPAMQASRASRPVRRDAGQRDIVSANEDSPG
jgi:hypothetical protein